MMDGNYDVDKSMPKPALTMAEIQMMQEQIMDQTAAVLATTGAAQLSMRVIAGHTGMTAANLYNYFGSKEELFLATKRRGFQLLDGFTTIPANTDESPRDQIKRILRGALQFARHWPGYWELIVHPPRNNAAIQERGLLDFTEELPSETVKRMMRVFTDLLAHSGVDISPGESPEDPPKIAAIHDLGFGPDTVWVRVPGFQKVFPHADEDLDRENGEKTSSVHFLRFELTEAMRKSLLHGSSLSIGVDHSNYTVEIEEVPENLRDSLAGDLSM